MRALVVGGGGREHAICRKLRKNGRFSKLCCAPGNAGIAEVAELMLIDAMESEEIRDFALWEKTDFTVIGVDDPLISGFAGFLEETGLKVLGLKKNAAILEGSRASTKKLMKKYEIPTATYRSSTDYEAVERYFETCKIPVMPKADGLALGKGVLVCKTREAVKEGLKEMMLERKFDASGDKMVIEGSMAGREVSMLSFVSDKTIRIVMSAQGRKRTKDDDRGLNTGGIGNYSPSFCYTDEIAQSCEERIYQHAVDAAVAEEKPLQGVIFFGLTLTLDGPRVLEYNARSDDLEAQVVLPCMGNDLLKVMLACVGRKFDEIQLKFCNKACVTTVFVSEGHSVKHERGLPISGLKSLKSEPDIYCYHVSMYFDDKGRTVTNGGQVFDVTALGKTTRGARERAYATTGKTSFADKYMRTDIALAGVAAGEMQQT